MDKAHPRLIRVGVKLVAAMNPCPCGYYNDQFFTKPSLWNFKKVWAVGRK